MTYPVVIKQNKVPAPVELAGVLKITKPKLNWGRTRLGKLQSRCDSTGGARVDGGNVILNRLNSHSQLYADDGCLVNGKWLDNVDGPPTS